MNAQICNEIIRRWYGGQSIRGVARDLKVARKTVKAVLERHEHRRAVIDERQINVGCILDHQ